MKNLLSLLFLLSIMIICTPIFSQNTFLDKNKNTIENKVHKSTLIVEGKVISEKLIGKPKASVTELVTAEKIISDMKNMDPMDAMKEANKVLKFTFVLSKIF